MPLYRDEGLVLRTQKLGEADRIVTLLTRRLGKVRVVGKDGQVSVREVQLGPVVDGLRVVRGGVAPTDRIVIVGTQLAQPGTKVQTRAGKIAPVVETAAPPSTALVGEATFTR